MNFKMGAGMDIRTGNKRDWFIRPYRDGDDDQLYELRRALDPDRYNSKQSWLRWWHWQCKEFPYGVITHVAEDNGKIIGRISTQTIDIKIGNDIVKARFPFDYAVHPDYRRQGVASALTAVVFDYFSKNERHISYGVPNQSGYQLAVKQGYVDVGCWKRMIRVLDWEHFLSEHINNRLFLKISTFCGRIFAALFFQARQAPDIDGLVIKEVPSFDERIDAFLSAVSGKYKIMRIKSRDYLNWRYATFTQSRFNIYIAEKFGTICGYIVLSKLKEKYKTKAAVYELIAASESIARCMISQVSERCRKDYVGQISWVGLADKTYLRAFRKQGFFSYPRRHQEKFVVYSSHPKIPIEYLTNPQNWFIQRGDLDL